MMFFEAINRSFEKRGRSSTDGGPKMRPPAGDDAGGRLLPKKHCLVLFMAKLKMSPTLRGRDCSHGIIIPFNAADQQSSHVARDRADIVGEAARTSCVRGA